MTAPQRASHLALLTGEDPAENRAQAAAAPFAAPVLDRVPRDWLAALPEQLLVARDARAPDRQVSPDIEAGKHNH